MSFYDTQSIKLMSVEQLQGTIDYLQKQISQQQRQVELVQEQLKQAEGSLERLVAEQGVRERRDLRAKVKAR